MDVLYSCCPFLSELKSLHVSRMSLLTLLFPDSLGCLDEIRTSLIEFGTGSLSRPGEIVSSTHVSK